MYKRQVGNDTLTNAVHKHYNPFAFKTDGTTAWTSGAHNGTSWPVGTGSSHNIDTATSLGLSNWLHSSNYYKPYNGGRVVIWVASDGTIKTSVTVMPPNAQNIASSAIAAKANAAVANNTHSPTFSGAIDNSLSEVAKTFMWREFGNGGSNGNPSFKDMSTVVPTTANQNLAYVMDDGLTATAGVLRDGNCANQSGGCFYQDNTGDFWFTTFIGTGFSIHGTSGGDNHIQNLSYGTHVIKYYRDGTLANSQWTIDGVNYYQAWGNHQNQISFYQPKMPPIPENAVVIADYMLMADFVPIPTGTAGEEVISKGVRNVNVSRAVSYTHLTLPTKA